MSSIIVVLLIFAVAVIFLGIYAYSSYRKNLYKAKSIERALKMVPLQIHLPPPSDDTEVGGRNLQDVLREKIAQAEVLYSLLAGTAKSGFSSKFYGQRHIALEMIATEGLIHFYAAVPVSMVSVVSQAIVTAYPGARVEESEDHNIFNQSGRLSGTLGGELMLKNESAYPIATYKTLERDPTEALFNTLSGLKTGEGVGIQFVIRPANGNWTRRAIGIAKRRRRQAGSSGGHGGVGGPTIAGLTPRDLAMAPLKVPEYHQSDQPLTGLEETAIQEIEEKTKHPGFEVLVRVVVSTDSAIRSQGLVSDIATAFALFEAPGLNGFQFLPAADSQGLVTAFIFRFFPPTIHSTILNSVELASIFHLPDAQFTPTTNVDRQASKQTDGPPSLPTTGLRLGTNIFRGVRKDIMLSAADRRRHLYVIGQTGTGKSTMLENLVVQDMLAGNGFAFIDPHGDTAEKLLGLVPKERAEDVIYFNPADMEYPMGLNLFEFDDPSQKDFLIQESINMLYKIYDPNKTGVIGPRFEQWYRNAALTLMSDPAGSTFIEIPQVFSDTEYLKRKFKYLTDPTVIDFWTKEMGQTSDYHKSEMLGYFASKFGSFLQNEMMRNILGQTKSAFNLRDIMDNKKILIVNLSKGSIGELNAQLLGLILVIKFQAAAMSRASIPEADRVDFSLYVDEFQNFSTDSFASILSEARKYHLNLIMANQFIGQLTDDIRDAVFGNIGTMISFRCGPEDAEFLVKQFAPVFDVRDLVNLPNFNSVVKLLVGGLPSQPFSMQGLPFVTNSNAELGLAIKQLSAAKFGHARASVEADIFSRLTGKPVTPTAVAPAPSAAAVPLSEPKSEPVSAPAEATPEPKPTPTPPPPAPETPKPVAAPPPVSLDPVAPPVASPAPKPKETEPVADPTPPPSPLEPAPPLPPEPVPQPEPAPVSPPPAPPKPRPKPVTPAAAVAPPPPPPPPPASPKPSPPPLEPPPQPDPVPVPEPVPVSPPPAPIVSPPPSAPIPTPVALPSESATSLLDPAPAPDIVYPDRPSRVQITPPASMSQRMDAAALALADPGPVSPLPTPGDDILPTSSSTPAVSPPSATSLSIADIVKHVPGEPSIQSSPPSPPPASTVPVAPSEPAPAPIPAPAAPVPASPPAPAPAPTPKIVKDEQLYGDRMAGGQADPSVITEESSSAPAARVASPKPTEPPKPKLAPGEVVVNPDGTISQG